MTAVTATWREVIWPHWNATSPTIDTRSVTNTSTTWTSCRRSRSSSFFTTTRCRWYYELCTASWCARPTNCSHRLHAQLPYTVITVVNRLLDSTLWQSNRLSLPASVFECPQLVYPYVAVKSLQQNSEI